MKKLSIILLAILVATTISSCNKKHQHKIRLEVVANTPQNDGNYFDMVGFIRGMNDVKKVIQTTESTITWEEVTDLPSPINYRLEASRHDTIPFTFKFYHNDELVKTFTSYGNSHLTVNISDDGTIK